MVDNQHTPIRKIYRVFMTRPKMVGWFVSLCGSCLTRNKVRHPFTKFSVLNVDEDGLICHDCKAQSPDQFAENFRTKE